MAGSGRRKDKQRPTIADVARQAGVSPMTVSRVVNREARVLPETRARVQQAIDALGYVPNAAARNLAGGYQCRLALLYGNPSSAYLSEFLLGSLAQAHECDALLLVEVLDPAEAADTLAQRLVMRRIDGVLLPPPLCDDAALIHACLSAGLAVTQIATGQPSPLAHAVTIDDESAAHVMATWLIKLGHRRIGFIAGATDQTASALRQAGFERALREAGIPRTPSLIVAGDFTYRSGLAAARKLLEQSPPPTAIFASNDDMAVATVALAHRMGLQVPDDLTVCGFDDTAIATTTWPELTTIRQPVAAMASEAVRLLDRDIRGRNRSPRVDHPVMHKRLHFALIKRHSHAKLPDR